MEATRVKERLGATMSGDAVYESPPCPPVDVLDILWGCLTGLMMLVSFAVIYLTVWGKEVVGRFAINQNSGGYMTAFGHWDVPSWPGREGGLGWMSPIWLAVPVILIGGGTFFIMKKSLRDGKGYGILLIVNFLVFMMMGVCLYTRYAAFSWGY